MKTFIYEEWDFRPDCIIHIPCNKKAKRFLGTHGRIWCTKCSARFPSDFEFIADAIYNKEVIEPWEFYGPYSISFYSGFFGFKPVFYL